jgi:hypothetical protein
MDKAPAPRRIRAHDETNPAKQAFPRETYLSRYGTTQQNPYSRPFPAKRTFHDTVQRYKTRITGLLIQKPIFDCVGTGLPTCPRGRASLQRQNLPPTHSLTRETNHVAARPHQQRYAPPSRGAQESAPYIIWSHICHQTGLSPRNVPFSIRYSVTKPVKKAFSRTNRLRLCRGRSPDLSARQEIPSTAHPPGDAPSHERNQPRRRTTPPPNQRPTNPGRTGERPYILGPYICRQTALLSLTAAAFPAAAVGRRPAPRRRRRG